MEFQYPISLPIFIATLFFFFISSIIILIVARIGTFDHRSKNHPPQPWKLPIVGNMHHLLGEQPHRAFKNLAEKLGPIFQLQLGEISAVVISSPLVAKEIMKTHDLSFADRPKLLCAEIIGYNSSTFAFSPYGNYWRQMRKICVLELLSAKKVQSFQSIREQESFILVEHVALQRFKSINLSENIFVMINTIISRVAVGTTCKDQGTLIALIKETINLASGFDVADLFPSIKLVHRISGMRNKLMKIHEKMDKILDNIISDHQERRGGGGGGLQINRENEDLLDVLLRLKYDGGLEFPITYDNIKAVILEMISAGTDTSSVTIEWAMSELIKNPRVMMKAQSELREALKGKTKIQESDVQVLGYLKLVIKETLRLHPPVPLLLPRENREKCEIGGYQIPIKSKVIINVWKIGRDPDNWVDPESFVPERFLSDDESSMNKVETDFGYLPFGAGRRMCPGMSLGLANVELPLAMLLYHFNWELPNEAAFESLDMSESFGATLKRKNDLVLVPTPYKTIDSSLYFFYSY
uniref:cytochrome P450 71AV8-like n=1 Tax=Erigeron canadensis TaxID=72917 RepID=UPI001CB9AB02|nr:cytochrome P450 71AV8-like [Erigeron canadensis]